MILIVQEIQILIHATHKTFNMYIYKANLKREMNYTIFKPFDKKNKKNKENSIHPNPQKRRQERGNNQKAWKIGKDDINKLDVTIIEVNVPN